MNIILKVLDPKNSWDLGPVTVPEGATVMDCVKMVAARRPELKLPDFDAYEKSSIVVINTKVSYYDSVLHDGDSLTIFPYADAG